MIRKDEIQTGEINYLFKLLISQLKVKINQSKGKKVLRIKRHL